MARKSARAVHAHAANNKIRRWIQEVHVFLNPADTPRQDYAIMDMYDIVVETMDL